MYNLKNLKQLSSSESLTMVEMEKNMRLALQRTVKQNLLESKYTDEPVSYE